MRFFIIITSLLLSCTGKNDYKNIEYIQKEQNQKQVVSDNMQNLSSIPENKDIKIETKKTEAQNDYPVTDWKEAKENVSAQKTIIEEKKEISIQKQPEKSPSKPMIFQPIHPPKEWSENQKAYIAKSTERFAKSTTSPQNKPDQALLGKKLSFGRFLRADGELVDIKDYEGKKNILLVILRGFAGSICLVCSSQTLALSQTAESFRAKNTEILLMYPGKGESVPEFLEALNKFQPGYEPPFSVLMDVDLEFINTMNLQASLARPTSIILDKNGIIRYAYIGQNPTDRPNVPILLQEIEKIQ